MIKTLTRYLNQDASGGLYVSKRPMNQTFYMTPQMLKCVPTVRTKITHNGVYVGAICVTTTNEILRIVDVINRDGYELNYDFRRKKKLKQLFCNKSYSVSYNTISIIK